MSLRSLPTALLMLMAVATVAAAADEMMAALYAELSLPVPTARLVVVCHGFGCQYRTEIALTNADRAKLGDLLAPGRASSGAVIRTHVSWPRKGTTWVVQVMAIRMDP